MRPLSPKDVIVVEVGSSRTERPQTPPPEAENHAATFHEWLVEEAAWLVVQFSRIAASVFLFRSVHQLFRTGLARESVYDRAEDFWRTGPDPEPAGPERRSERPRGFEASAPDDEPRFVTTVGPHHLYLHRTVLDPEGQYWPCPLLLWDPCESCRFLAHDAYGRPRCAAVVKIRNVLRGEDAGEDLEELLEGIAHG